MYDITELFKTMNELKQWLNRRNKATMSTQLRCRIDRFAAMIATKMCQT